MIDKIDSVEDPQMEKVLSSIFNQAMGLLFTSTLPTTDTVPQGKLVIYDNGSGTKRLYVKTGKDNIGYVALT